MTDATGHANLTDLTDEDPVDDVGHIDDLVARLGVTSHRRPRRVELATSQGRISALDWVDDGETPEYLFVHGGGLNAHAWDSTMVLLDRPARAIDLPGHGWSEWRADADYRPSTIAPAVAETAPSAPFVLVGHSLGGLVSTLAMPQLAARPTAFIMVDISPVSISVGGRAPRGLYEPDLSFASREDAVEWAIEQGLGRTRETLEIGIRFNTRRRADGRYVFRHHLAHLRPTPELFERDESLYWSAFDERVPTVLVQASRGRIDDAQLDAVRARAPWVRVERVESGHNVHSQAPEELVEIIRELAD